MYTVDLIPAYPNALQWNPGLPDIYDNGTFHFVPNAFMYVCKTTAGA